MKYIFLIFTTVCFAYNAKAQTAKLPVDRIISGQNSNPEIIGITPNKKFILTTNKVTGSIGSNIYVTINVWNTEDFSLYDRIPLAYYPKGNVFLTSNNEVVVSILDQNELQVVVWDIERKSKKIILDTIDRYRPRDRKGFFSPIHQTYIVLLNEPYFSKIKIIDSTTNAIIKVIDSTLYSIHPSADGSQFISAQASKSNSPPYLLYTHFLYNSLKGEVLDTLEGYIYTDLHTKMLPNNKILSVHHGSFRIYDITSRRYTDTIQTNGMPPYAISPDGQYLGFVNNDTLKIYDMINKRITEIINFEKQYIYSLAFLNKDSVLIGSSSWPNQFYMVYSLRTKELSRKLTQLSGTPIVRWIDTTHYITNHNQLTLWDYNNGRIESVIDSSRAQSISTFENSEVLAYISSDSSIISCHPTTNTTFFIHKPLDKNPSSVALGPDGVLAVGYRGENPVEIRDAYSGHVEGILSGSRHTSRIGLSPDGNYLAVGQEALGTALQIWSRKEKKITVPFVSLWRGQHYSFSADSRYLMLALPDSSVHFINVVTGKVEKIFDFEGTGYITNLITFQDKYLLGSTYEGLIYVWDIQTTNLIATYTLPSASIASMSISVDNKIILGLNDGSIIYVSPLQFPTSIAYTNSLLKESIANAFPNPASSNITLEFTNKEQSIGQIEIFDIRGVLKKAFLKELFKQGENSFAISTQDLTAGMYYAKITASETVQFVKFAVR